MPSSNWICQSLLQTESDTALFGLDRENDGVDAVALLEDVAGVAELLAVGHFRNMDQTLHTGLDLDECPKIGEPCHGSGNALTGEQAFRRLLPGLGLQLFQAE